MRFIAHFVIIEVLAYLFDYILRYGDMAIWRGDGDMGDGDMGLN